MSDKRYEEECLNINSLGTRHYLMIEPFNEDYNTIDKKGVCLTIQEIPAQTDANHLRFGISCYYHITDPDILDEIGTMFLMKAVEIKEKALRNEAN